MGDSYQQRARDWLEHCFGRDRADDPISRNHRFLEEALELVQALGCTKDEAHQLVNYVFGRGKGSPEQEVGGVRLSLSGLTACHRIDEHAAAEDELARVWTMVEQIREKERGKPDGSPLPGPGAGARTTTSREAAADANAVANGGQSATDEARLEEEIGNREFREGQATRDAGP